MEPDEIKKRAEAKAKALSDRWQTLKDQQEVDLRQILEVQTDILFEVLQQLQMVRWESWQTGDMVSRISPPLCLLQDRHYAPVCNASALEGKLSEIIKLLGGTYHDVSL